MEPPAPRASAGHALATTIPAARREQILAAALDVGTSYGPKRAVYFYYACVVAGGIYARGYKDPYLYAIFVPLLLVIVLISEKTITFTADGFTISRPTGTRAYRYADVSAVSSSKFNSISIRVQGRLVYFNSTEAVADPGNIVAILALRCPQAVVSPSILKLLDQADAALPKSETATSK